MAQLKKAYLVIENGETFQGRWLGGLPKAGEVVFNTSHSGYEEIATDPSYFNQIMVMTSTQQGNYRSDPAVWESDQIHIRGFICQEMQNSLNNKDWLSTLLECQIPVVDRLLTRELVLRLRDQGTPWGALVPAETEAEAKKASLPLIEEAKSLPKDWTALVSRDSAETIAGQIQNGPRVAVVDFGAKKNIIRELQSRCSEIRVFPSQVEAEEIHSYKPDGVMLSNGPGDPADVQPGPETISALIGKYPIFGICMGHQILARALGAKTTRLKFGHRGSNHPIRDEVLKEVYVTSQNHGYVVDPKSLPAGVRQTHTNLNDQTLAGLIWDEKKLMSVQFHPESHPGPHDSVKLFDRFVEMMS